MNLSEMMILFTNDSNYFFTFLEIAAKNPSEISGNSKNINSAISFCLDGRCITITVAHNPSHLSIYNRHVDKKITFSVGVSSKATGRMGSATVWELRVAASGCTGASGPRASRGDTECASQPRHPPSMRAPGLTGCRTVTAQKHTLMEVRLDSH